VYACLCVGFQEYGPTAVKLSDCCVHKYSQLNVCFQCSETLFISRQIETTVILVVFCLSTSLKCGVTIEGATIELLVILLV